MRSDGMSTTSNQLRTFIIAQMFAFVKGGFSPLKGLDYLTAQPAASCQGLHTTAGTDLDRRAAAVLPAPGPKTSSGLPGAPSGGGGAGGAGEKPYT